MPLLLSINSGQLTSLMDEDESLNGHFIDHLRIVTHLPSRFVVHTGSHISERTRTGARDMMPEIMTAKNQKVQKAIIQHAIAPRSAPGPSASTDKADSLVQSEYLIEPSIDPG